MVRTPLFRPDRYFAEREISFVRGLVVAALVIATVIAAVGGIGLIFTEKVDGSVVVDNPDRPPEEICDMHEESAGETSDAHDVSSTEINATDMGCDEPEQIERNVDPLIHETLYPFYGLVLVAGPIGLSITGVLLHLGTALAGGTGGFRKTLSVTAWGAAPLFVTLPLLLVALWLVVDPVTVSPPAGTAEVERRILVDFQVWLLIASGLSLLSSVWGGVIWTFGLEHGRNVSRAKAAAVAGFVTLGSILV